MYKDRKILVHLVKSNIVTVGYMRNVQIGLNYKNKDSKQAM